MAMETIEEAYLEMQRRGWGFARGLGIVAVGPIRNPDYKSNGESPLIEVYAVDKDPLEAVKKAIKFAEALDQTIETDIDHKIETDHSKEGTDGPETAE